MVYVQVKGNGKAGVLKCKSYTGEFIQASINTLQGVQPCTEQPISRFGLTLALTSLSQLSFFKGLQIPCQDKVWCYIVKNVRSCIVFCFLLLVTPHWVWMLSACSVHMNATVTTALLQCSAKGKKTACSWQVKTHPPKQNYKYKHNLSIKMSFCLRKLYFNLQMRRPPKIISAPTAQIMLILALCFFAKSWTTGKRSKN